MREIRPYGSEGGEVLTDLSYPYRSGFYLYHIALGTRAGITSLFLQWHF
jgi:hypothetical protein